jgi:hypothetical protein
MFTPNITINVRHVWLHECAVYVMRKIIKLISSSWWWRHFEPVKRRATAGAASQKALTFILAAVRAWNLTELKFWQWRLLDKEMQTRLWWGLTETAFGGVLESSVRRSVLCWCVWWESGFTRCEDVTIFNLLLDSPPLVIPWFIIFSAGLLENADNISQDKK